MSLLSTSSTTNQEAYLYENHYPQPIIIEPNSQICLQKFIHFRGSFYEVTTQNNTIGFRFGTGGTNQDVPHFNTIPSGSYDGEGLAEAVEIALNAVNQQQNYNWTVDFLAPAASADPDRFQITYVSVPTPDENSGSYNTFDSGEVAISNQGIDNEEAKISYNGLNAAAASSVISKRSTLVYLGSQTWNMIQPNTNNERFQPLQMGLVRDRLSNPANPNPNLAFTNQRYDISMEFDGVTMGVTYGRQRQGSVIGAPNWFQSDVRRNLSGLFDPIFNANGGVFDPHVKLECKLSIYASSQSSRRVIIQLLKKGQGETTYTALADGLGGNSPETNTPFVKTLIVGTDSFPGTVFDSNDPSLNDTGTKIAQHYPKMSEAPFFPTVTFQKAASQVQSGYTLDGDTWENPAGTNVVTFTELIGNTNGYSWRTNASNAGTTWDGLYWFQVDPLTYHIKGGNVPLTSPPLYIGTLDPTGNTNGTLTLTDGITGTVVGNPYNYQGATPVALETSPLAIFTQGIFNTTEPIESVGGSGSLEVEGTVGGGALQDLSSNARLFLRGSGGGAEADVANLLGFSNNEEDFGGGAATGASVTSDQEPDQTANNNTLHISIPEMPLVKSYEGENSAEAKSIAIIPREEFGTGEDNQSLVYVAPFENWIDINNGQQLNINLITTLVRNADGSLADNLVNETQAVFKIRQDPMKIEEDRKAERFREMAEMMANTINTGLTSLISPNQLIGS